MISEAEYIALEVCSKYIELIKAAQLIALAENNIEQHQAIFDLIQGRVDKGLSSQSDLAQVTARLASSQSDLINARRNIFDVQAQFYSLTGISQVAPVTPVVDQSLMPKTLNDALNKARFHNPQLRSAKADIAAVNQEFRASKSEYYPTISLDARLYDNNDVGAIEGPDNGHSIMLNVKYNLFDGLRTTNRVKASGWRYQEAHSVHRQATLKIEEQIKVSWNSITFLRQQEDVLKMNVDAAVATDAGYNRQFELGRRSLLDVLDGKIEVYIARKNYLTTFHDRVLAEYRLTGAMGILNYALRVEYPEQWQENRESWRQTKHDESNPPQGKEE